MKTATRTLRGLAFVLASTLALGASAEAADNLNRWVEVENETPLPIVSVEAINVDYYGDWHRYLSYLAVGNSVWVNIDDGLGYCRFDIYFAFRDGSEAFAEDVNVCDESWVLAYSTYGDDRRIVVA